MTRIALTVFLLVGLSGCIKLQMPDDLVSDTVDVIRGVDDDAPADVQTDDANVFSHSVAGAADAPVAALMTTCRSELESRVAELLDTTEFALTTVSENVSVVGGKAIATCSVEVETTGVQRASVSSDSS